MKKAIFVLCVVSVLLTLTGCDYHKVNNNISLPKYLKEECYWSDDYKDYCDYCKYYYDTDGLKEFEKNKNFKPVTDADIQRIKVCLSDFSVRVKTREFSENYDFDFETQISTEDLWCFIGEYPSDNTHLNKYTIYYLDVSKKILYFFNLKI